MTENSRGLRSPHRPETGFYPRTPRRFNYRPARSVIQLIYCKFGNRPHTKDDFLSGLTVALALVPEAVAFAIIAGVQPLVGLYAAFIDGHIYLHGRDKKLHCIDLAKGKAKWSTDEEFEEYWSIIQKGNRVLALYQQGILVLFEATPEAFKPLDRREISPKNPTWAHIGLDDNRDLIRSLKGVSVWGWK